ncbi:transposase family protein [Streptomyces sp. NPDC058128]|uniref:helix-turn-helix domain-containing protein n=1 Tax=Streptomyces sp. NPDC058128 TaxID=3346352 RepID=UPI0036E4273F
MHRLVFVDRLLATLGHLRHGGIQHVSACWFGVDRSTITRAIGEVRPLLAERGARSAPASGCGPWPRPSTTSAPANRRGPGAVVQPDRARQLCGHHPSPSGRTGQAPGRRPRCRESCRWGLPPLEEAQLLR